MCIRDSHYNERGNEVFLVKHLDKIKEKKRNPPQPARKKRVLTFGATKARNS